MLRGSTRGIGEIVVDIRRGGAYGNPYPATSGLLRCVSAYAALRGRDDRAGSAEEREASLREVAEEWGCPVHEAQARGFGREDRERAEGALVAAVQRGRRVALRCGCSGLCHGDVIVARVLTRLEGDWPGVVVDPPACPAVVPPGMLRCVPV